MRGVLERIAQRPAWLESLGTPLQTLPPDLVERAGDQIRKAALAFAGIWAFILIIAYPIAYAFEGGFLARRGFPHPGTELVIVGLLTSLGMAWYASRTHTDRERVLSLALGHQVVTAGLVSAIAWWAPGDTFRTSLSPICLFLPIYPALAPLSSRRVLFAGLLAATTDVLGWSIAVARGVAPPAPPLQMFFAFSTTYLCAILSVLPATIIRRLGRAVQEARDMGAYRLENLIGKGGMGEVYRASHRLLARPAAVKVIGDTDLNEMSVESRTRALERFRREAAVAAALTSPHTIGLYDFGVTESGTYYYVMELLHGMDLQVMVDRHGPLPPARALHFLRQTAISLAEAHQFGIVHRDIKPSNIYASRLGLEVDFTKVLDFGVVKVEVKRGGEEALKLSREDVPIGTPAYMAPEGVDGGGALTPQSDVYSLGCVAFFLLTGELTFHASSVLQMAMKHMEEAPRTPSVVRPDNGITPELDALILRCLSKKPEDRPADGLALLTQLIPIANAMPWSPELARAWWDEHVPVESPRPVIPPIWEYGGNGPVIHIAPANGFPPATYLPLFEGLKRDHRIVCVPPRALRGLGPPPAKAGSWESVADDLVAGWEAHHLAPVIAVGHSFGAVASLLASIRARHLVRALILLDPTIREPRIMAQAAAAKKAHGEVRFHLVDTALRRRATFETRESAFAYWRRRRLFNDWSDEALQRYADAMLRPAPEGVGFTLEWPAEWETWYYRSFYPGTWDDIPHLDQGLPLLIIGGENSDTLSAESAARLRELLPRATHVTLPGAGHLFPQSHPAETRAILERWLAGIA